MQINFTTPPHPTPLQGKAILPPPTLRIKLPTTVDKTNSIQPNVKPSLIVKCTLGDSNLHVESDFSRDVNFEKLQSYLFGSTATIDFDKVEKVFIATFAQLKINLSGFQVFEDGSVKKKTKQV